MECLLILRGMVILIQPLKRPSKKQTMLTLTTVSLPTLQKVARQKSTLTQLRSSNCTSSIGKTVAVSTKNNTQCWNDKIVPLEILTNIHELHGKIQKYTNLKIKNLASFVGFRIPYRMELVNHISDFQNFLTSLPNERKKQVRIVSQ